MLYVGGQTEIDLDREVGVSGAVVKRLVQPYLGCGHVMYLDNWYTSPLLARYLFQHKTGICGTVKKMRKHMPHHVGKMERKQVIFFKENILATTWMDKREVNMLSTVHKHVVLRTKSIDWKDEHRCHVWKPECVVDYNINMRLVDQSDAMISSIDCARPSIKWYKKLFFHLLDVSVLNAHILHREVTGKKDTLEEFALEVCRELFAKYGKERPSQSLNRSSADSPLRLTARHFPESVPRNENGRYVQRRCHVCSHTSRRPRKRTDSRFQCTECDVGLCIVPCFKEYHMLLHY